MPSYQILWHPRIKDDLQRLPADIRESIVRSADHKLSHAPWHLGRALQGTKKLLFRARHGDYRIVYTINEKEKEIWILCVQHRKFVYRESNIRRLSEIAKTLRHGRA
ncbi:type II toxin-antitoxin system RelE/ParE family toxin [Elusimicrobiota bacterium]